MLNGKWEMADNNNVEVKLKNVRLSFFHGFVPQPRKNDAGVITGYNFNTAILLDKEKDAEQIKAVQEAMRAAKTAKWGASPPRLAADKICLRDGEPIDPDTQQPVALYDGYAGCLYVSANRPVKVEEYELIKQGKKTAPVTIIGPRKGQDGRFPRLDENSEFAPYSGCYANVIIRIYGYADAENPSRINASLEAVQFARHGEPFASRSIDADSAFDEVEGEDDFDAPAEQAQPAAAGSAASLLG
jgi:hypothetical protein